MRVCGYCKHYQGFANKTQYGICRENNSEYSDGGTFSTNSCPKFEHWRTSLEKKERKESLCQNA